MRLQFNNLGSFFAELSNIPETVVKDTHNLIKETTVQMQAEATSKAPVDTGNLKANITSSMKSDIAKHKGEVVSGAEYSIYVEFGTGERGEASNIKAKEEFDISYTKGWSGQQAQPFFFPAYYKAEKRFTQIFNKLKRKYNGK